MSEFKTSDLLTELFAKAKMIGKTPNAPVTAERFLVAVIDELNDDANQGVPEVRDLGKILQAFVQDPFSAKQEMLDYIAKSSFTAILDDLKMKNYAKRAAAVADELGAPSVTATMLLLCIVKDPNVTIKPVVAEVNSVEGLEDICKAVDKLTPESVKDGESTPDTQEESTPSVHAPKLVRKSTIEPEEPEKAEKPEVPEKPDMAALVADVKRIRAELHSSIFGQDNAINVFISGYFQARMLSMMDKNRKRPNATFLFAGPPGVGKTFLAEKAAEALGLPFKRFDMSEYCEKEAAVEFIGSDKVYKDSGEGNFTSFVNQYPKCVVLFDEIEKAHISIIHLFLQILDAGRIRDSKTDREIPLKDAIFIFTTNAGKQLYQGSEDQDLSTISRKVIIDALEKDVNPSTNIPYFPSAICSRFASGNVVMFNHIGVHNLRNIAKKEIQRNAKNLKESMGIDVQMDEHTYTALLFSEGTKADARTTRSRAEAFFNDELYELLRLVSSSKGAQAVSEIEKIEVCVDLENLPDGIEDLFTMGENSRIMMLADESTVALCRSKKPTCDFIGVQSSEQAIKTLKNSEIDLIILDVNYGAPQGAADKLNVEDVMTPARKLLQLLRDNHDETPVYLLESAAHTINEEEKISYLRQGVRGFMYLSEGEDDTFLSSLDGIISVLHQQESMIKLARENKLISFETSQSISDDNKTATIQLFDFKTAVAVDAEDSKSILSSASRPNVRFADVIGAEDAKKELQYFVEYLKNPKKYLGTGVKAPKGIILHGPPGTGKTMLAKAMASEAGVTFIAAEGNQFVKKYVGEGSEAVHEIFRKARKYAPAILFIDEIDAIAKERNGGDDNGTEQTLTAFLTEMDGFNNNTSKPVFVLAATNFDVEPGSSKSLDPALMRRFDRRVYIDLPNMQERVRFLKMKIDANRALQISDEKVNNIAMRATGMSLASLDSVVELALRSAIREGSITVTDAIFDEAFETFNGGEVKKWDATLLERVARHEAGHALMCWLGGDTPSYITIVARGGHGGYVMPTQNEGKALYTKEELLARIRTSLGGRAAEVVYYGEKDGLSTGPSGDLSSATSVAQSIVCSYGMDDEFGLAVVGDVQAMNGAMSVEVRAAVNKILNEQLTRTIALVTENKDKIDALVAELMAKNHLNGAEIERVFNGTAE